MALKLLLIGRSRRLGSRFATSIGAWVNFVLLLWFAARGKPVRCWIARLVQSACAACRRRRWRLRPRSGWRMRPSRRLFGARGLARTPLTLAALAAIGAAVYGGMLMALFGREWLALYARATRRSSRLIYAARPARRGRPSAARQAPAP